MTLSAVKVLTHVAFKNKDKLNEKEIEFIENIKDKRFLSERQHKWLYDIVEKYKFKLPSKAKKPIGSSKLAKKQQKDNLRVKTRKTTTGNKGKYTSH